MGECFSEILTVTVQGGIVILAVMALRLMLKKAPKSAICLLWLLAGLRLLLPFQIESSFSLQPDHDVVSRLEWAAAEREDTEPWGNAGAARGEILDSNGEVLAEQDSTGPVWDTGAARGEILDKNGEVLVEKPISPAQAPAEETWDWTNAVLLIWLAGVLAMGVYTTASYWQLKRKVADAVILEEGVWVSSRIDTPFLLGFVQPKIYLPLGLTEWERPYVLAHERAHIVRRDHWWKLLGFIALALHWFNPLVWVGYVLLCRDLEMACDEAVVKSMDVSDRKAYSAALVSCSAKHTSIAACPVAFGEVSVKERVKHVLKFKKPGFWITILAVIAAVFVAVFFLTSPGQTMKEKAVESLYSELEKLQSSENIHLTVSTTIDGEYDYYTGHEQEFWKHGDDWYRVMDIVTTDGTYREEYLQRNGNQYACRDSDNITGLESHDWIEIPEANRLQLFVLLTRDWTQCEILEVREEVSEDGGVITVLVQGELEGDSKKTYYAHTHAFHLDENYRLVGVVEYSSAEKYISDRGITGRFDQSGYSAVRFLEADETEITRQINEATQEAADKLSYAALMSEEDMEQRLEEVRARHEAFKNYEDWWEVLLERCEEAILDFQSRENICLLVDNQFSGDILNDCSSVQHFQSGRDWLNITLISNADFSDEHYALEKDGEYYERYVSVIHNPANGEGIDSGWVADVDGVPCIPWVKTVQWDELLITAVDQETVDGKTQVTMTIFGSPYEMEEEVTQYQVTFVFQNTELTAELSQVILEYDKSWPMLDKKTTGVGHVISTIHLNAAAHEEALKRIEEMYAQAVE